MSYENLTTKVKDYIDIRKNNSIEASSMQCPLTLLNTLVSFCYYVDNRYEELRFTAFLLND